MYSLYRAWFGDSVTPDNYSRLQETLSPPDTVVRVGNEGEHQFVAHKGVLAAHSGYLKALLTSAAATPPSQGINANITSCANMPATAIAVTATNLSGQSTRQPVTSVSVSSIGKYCKRFSEIGSSKSDETTCDCKFVFRRFSNS